MILRFYFVNINGCENYFSIPPSNLSCNSFNSSHLPSAANLACFGQVSVTMCANLELASLSTLLNSSGFAFATFSKVSKPAATNASAALGPAPSIFFKSSAFPVAFLGAAFASTFLTSFFGAAFLAPEAVIPSITISVKDCLCPFFTR